MCSMGKQLASNGLNRSGVSSLCCVRKVVSSRLNAIQMSVLVSLLVSSSPVGCMREGIHCCMCACRSCVRVPSVPDN